MAISILDFGFGNVGSVSNMLRALEINFSVVGADESFDSASRIILPGVGSFDAGITSITSDKRRYDAILEHVCIRQLPILGICLGMQVLCKGSDEGEHPGLGLIDGFVEKFVPKSNFPVPNMGWRYVDFPQHTKLGCGFDSHPRFYFAHSYALKKAKVKSPILSNYDAPFIAGFESDNIFGVQFHPEKSHNFGKNILKNFSIV